MMLGCQDRGDLAAISTFALKIRLKSDNLMSHFHITKISYNDDLKYRLSDEFYMNIIGYYYHILLHFMHISSK